MTSFIDAIKNENQYLKIADYYSQAFEQHGATPQGLAWDNQENLNKRYEVMYDIVKYYNASILDFGCGYCGFYEWILKNKKTIKYTGLDINLESLEVAYKNNPNLKLWHLDIHDPKFSFDGINNWDYIICNGTFTVKGPLTQEEMTNFMCSTLEKLWTKTNRGIAFNCMSKILDFERDDLFHVSFDELSMWVYDNLSSKFTIRQDYSLREFTMYVYK